MRQNDTTSALQLVYARNGSQNSSQYSKNKTMMKSGKNGHHVWAIAFANWSVWVNIKIAKSVRETALKAH